MSRSNYENRTAEWQCGKRVLWSCRGTWWYQQESTASQVSKVPSLEGKLIMSCGVCEYWLFCFSLSLKYNHNHSEWYSCCTSICHFNFLIYRYFFFSSLSFKRIKTQQLYNFGIKYQQILEAAPYKTKDVQLLTSHLANHISKTRLVGCVLWHINPDRLFNMKSCLYTHLKMEVLMV